MSTTSKILDRNSIQAEQTENLAEQGTLEEQLASAIVDGDFVGANEMYSRIDGLGTRLKFLQRLMVGITEREQKIETEQDRRRWTDEVEPSIQGIQVEIDVATDAFHEATVAWLEAGIRFSKANQKAVMFKAEGRKLARRFSGSPNIDITISSLVTVYVGSVRVREIVGAVYAEGGFSGRLMDNVLERIGIKALGGK